ncbi:MAG: ribosome biogenesis GTPase Der [Rickettsiales bacterium]
MTLPLIAIIGRPNVGKSTLFNRLAGKKLALVDDQPGVTRDRRYADGSLADLRFRLIDTAGMDEAEKSGLESRMLEQTRAAIMEADLVLFVVDVRMGVTPMDEHFAREIRQSGKPTILIANKAESARTNAGAGDVYSLGFEPSVFLSAEHGEGMGDLFDALVGQEGFGIQDSGFGAEKKKKPNKRAEKKSAERGEVSEGPSLNPESRIPNPGKPINLVILGRPNAGKSTLVNALLGENRLLTGPEAGITRDTIAIPFDYQGMRFMLHDTAGMRKRANVQGKLEKLAVSDAIRALTFAEVVVILLDAMAPLEKQDAALAALVEREGRACVIGLNKWDLVKGDKKAWLEEIHYLLNKNVSQLAGVHVVPLSAARGQGLDKLLSACLSAREVWNQRVGTAELNRWLETTIQHHSPPLVRGRRLKVKYIAQVKARPPTFQLACNMAKEFPEAYLRYLTSHLRTSFKLEGTPIRLLLQESSNPFDKKKRRVNQKSAHLRPEKK